MCSVCVCVRVRVYKGLKIINMQDLETHLWPLVVECPYSCSVVVGGCEDKLGL